MVRLNGKLRRALPGNVAFFILINCMRTGASTTAFSRRCGNWLGTHNLPLILFYYNLPNLGYSKSINKLRKWLPETKFHDTCRLNVVI